MTEPQKTQAREQPTLWQLVILALSIYVLLILTWETFFKPSAQVVSILRAVDTLICFVFLGDFFARLAHAENKLQFLKWGWIDFVSSIPALDAFRLGRLVRVLRILRVLRAVRSARVIWSLCHKQRVGGTFASAMLVTLTLMFLASIAILNFEDQPTSNIQNAEDAMWWAVSTMTTVGYGDRFPVTTEGRILGALLMTAGVGLFGIFTGYIASWFVEREPEPTSREVELQAQLTRLESKIDDLRRHLRINEP